MTRRFIVASSVDDDDGGTLTATTVAATAPNIRTTTRPAVTGTADTAVQKRRRSWFRSEHGQRMPPKRWVVVMIVSCSFGCSIFMMILGNRLLLSLLQNRVNNEKHEEHRWLWKNYSISMPSPNAVAVVPTARPTAARGGTTTPSSRTRAAMTVVGILPRGCFFAPAVAVVKGGVDNSNNSTTITATTTLTTCGTLIAQHVRAQTQQATHAGNSNTDDRMHKNVLHQIISNDDISEEEDRNRRIQRAALVVARSYPIACGQCMVHYDYHNNGSTIENSTTTPAAANSNDTNRFIYHDFDSMSPGNSNHQLPRGAGIHRSVSHYLSSIPVTMRLPFRQYHENRTEFLRDRGNLYPQREYLFETNPSIVLLPEHIRTRLMAQHGHRGWDAATDTAAAAAAATTTPYYLASFRVTNVQQCVPRSDVLTLGAREGLTHGEALCRDNLGLALLRQDLSILVDGVYIISCPYWGDYRLFVLYEELYVSSFAKLRKLSLFPPSHDDTTIYSTIHPIFPESTMPPIYLSHVDIIYKLPNSKNMHYFVDADNRTILQVYPHAPHIAFPVEIDAMNINPSDHDKNLPWVKAAMEAAQATAPTLPAMIPSFATLEEALHIRHLMGRPLWDIVGGDRGSACCIEMEDPRQKTKRRTLLVGISHVKFWPDEYTKWSLSLSLPKMSGRQRSPTYLSRLYAFDPKSLSHNETVVVSGRFCLSFPSPDEPSSNPWARSGDPFWFPYDNFVTRREKTTLHGDATINNGTIIPSITNNSDRIDSNSHTHDRCPRIHFISGMTRSIDPTKVIIAYGVNDCSSRLIEVDLAELQLLLFPKTMSETN